MIAALRRAFVLTALLLASPVANGDTLKPLSVAVGLSLPPYIIADERRGMEYDIVREALAASGYELVPVFMDFGDVLQAIENGEVDAAMTYPGGLDSASALSQAHIVYHNHAMTLASRGIVVDTIADLAGKSVMAFQNARAFLSDPYNATVDRSAVYTEVPDQSMQNLALFQGDVEVVIADINIFNWFAHDPRVTSGADTGQAVAYHAIFPPTPYHVAFQDPAIRDAFDTALSAMKQDGRYDAVIARYDGVQ